MEKCRHTRSLTGLLAIFLLFSFTFSSSLHAFGFNRDVLTKIISKKSSTSSRADVPFPFEEQQNEDLEDDSQDEKDNKSQQSFSLACLPYVFVLRANHSTKTAGHVAYTHFCGQAQHLPLYLAKRSLLL